MFVKNSGWKESGVSELGSPGEKREQKELYWLHSTAWKKASGQKKYPPKKIFFKFRYFFAGLFLIWLCQVLVVAYGSQFPDQGSNPGPLHWEHGVSATGPPGKSLMEDF